jgi:hypothetical protein
VAVRAKLSNYVLGHYSKWLSRTYDINNTIVISGVPRGGTTWLYEMLLESIPRSCGIWEPLSLESKYNVRVRQLNFAWRQYMDPMREWKEAEGLFRDILAGANINRSYIYNYSSTFEYLKRISSSETYVIKFCRANRLLKWMVEKVHDTVPILLVRHPCAVVSSQLEHGSWKHVKEESSSEHPVLNPEYLKKEPWIMKIVRKISRPEEKLAVTWCLDHYVPLSSPKPHPWILTAYEKLVTDGENEIRRIFAILGREVPKEIWRYLKRPSTSTKEDSNVARGGDRLSTWKRRLNEGQQRRVLSLVSDFGLDFYTDKLEPDYARLHGDAVEQKNGK